MIVDAGSASWPGPSAIFEVEIDPDTGSVVCRRDGLIWSNVPIVDPAWMTTQGTQYQIQTELFQSVDQMVGRPGAPALFSGAEFRRHQGGWEPTSLDLTLGYVWIVDIQPSGADDYQVPSESHEWGIGTVTNQGFAVWDKVVEF
jgi:hypothetical protein